MKASNAGMDGAVMNVVFFGAMNCMGSAVVIAFNKYLLSAHRFPFVSCLVIAHCAVGWAMAAVLYLLKPSWFPSLIGEKKVNVNFELIAKGALPIAWLFAAQLVLSNMALEFCSIAFLQMMKESNIVTVYVMSIFVGRETFSLLQILILVMMVMATCLCVKGEMHLSVTGCLLQVASCFCESAKTVTQSLLVSGSGKKLDPLSAVLVVMPVCAAILGSILALHWLQLAAIPGIELPSARDFEKNRWELAANIMIAFVLNVVIAVFLKCSSPITLVLTGNIKDIVIVSMSSMIMREPISRTQCVAFGLQIMLVFLWSALKQNPSWIQPRMLLSSEHKYKGLPT
mmetsp:Transcript_19988/g.35475  ORF Transcript_19988/g.35475 Transcript_19988/m.35475 type:complete len:342 (-) Transcript_19988:155-1180(-)